MSEPPARRSDVFHPTGNYTWSPPAKDRTPQRRVCPSCELAAETNASTCPVCGARYKPPLHERLMRRIGRA